MMPSFHRLFKILILCAYFIRQLNSVSYDLPLHKNEFCHTGLRFLSVSTSVNQSVVNCLNLQENSAIGYVSLNFPEFVRIDGGNINHNFQEFLWPFAAYLTICMGHKRLNCHMNNISETQWYRVNESSSQTFFMRSILEDICVKQDWHNKIPTSVPCNVSIALKERATEHQLRGINSIWQRSAVFAAFRRGAETLLNITAGNNDSNHTVTSQHNVASTHKKQHTINSISLGAQNTQHSSQIRVKKVVIYTRILDGENGRHILQADRLVSALSEKLNNNRIDNSLRYDVIKVDDLSNMTHLSRYLLFSTCDVFIAGHGGWIPNTVFMNDERSDDGHQKLIITLAKKSSRNYESYQKWDSSFKTPFMHVMVLWDSDKSSGHPNSLHCPSCKVVNTTANHYEIQDPQQIVDIIHKNYNQTSVADETVGHYFASRAPRRFPDGTLIKLHSDDKYYVMESGMKRLVPHEQVDMFLSAYDLKKSDAIVMHNESEFHAIHLYDYLVLP